MVRDNLFVVLVSLGRAERSALRSHISNIIEHLLKLDHGQNREPERGWRQTVKIQRLQVKKVLKDNPSLRQLVAGLVLEEFTDARTAALAGFERYEPDRLAHYEQAIPTACPYSESDILGDD